MTRARSAAPRTPRRAWALALAAAPLLSCVPTSGGGPPDAGSPDVGASPAAPPSTEARPAGGAYGAVQYVRLISDRLATVYWSVDGADPAPGAANTRSGTNPVFWVRVGPGTTSLKFFAVDADGIREPVHSETYEVVLPPAITFTGPEPAPIAVLSGAAIEWESDQDGSYDAVLSGSGVDVPLASGAVSAGARMSQRVTASDFIFGGPARLSVRVETADGRTGHASMLLDLAPPVVVGSSGCEDVVISPDGRRAYVSGHDSGGGGLTVVDIDPASPTFRAVLLHEAPLPGGNYPGRFAVVPDGQRVYVTDPNADSIYAVSAADGALLATIAPVWGAGTIAITPDGRRAYARGNGEIVALDIDPASATYHQLVGSIAPPSGLPLTHIAFTPDGRRAVASLAYGGTSHELDIIDVDPTSATYHQVVAQPVPATAGDGGPLAMSPDGQFVYAVAGSAECGFCKIDLASYAIVARTDRPPEDWALAVTPDGQNLLAPFTNEILIYGATELRGGGGAPVVVPGLRSIDALAVTPDGTRAYAAISPVSWGICQLVEVQLR